MSWDKKAITISEIKRLFHELHDRQPYTCIRFRFIGEMWQQRFVQIFAITDDHAIFYDDVTKRLVKISDFASIMQFELDHNFQNFIAYFHYTVTLEQ
jgi:hypothetical protein